MAREGMSIVRQDVLYTALLLALSLAGTFAHDLVAASLAVARIVLAPADEAAVEQRAIRAHAERMLASTPSMDDIVARARELVAHAVWMELAPQQA